jgi:hypothetical protein
LPVGVACQQCTRQRKERQGNEKVNIFHTIDFRKKMNKATNGRMSG